METVAEEETLPRESVTVAVKVIVPDEFKNPVVKLEAVLVNPPPVIEYEEMVEP